MVFAVRNSSWSIADYFCKVCSETSIFKNNIFSYIIIIRTFIITVIIITVRSNKEDFTSNILQNV